MILRIGADIGSTTVKAVVLNEENKLLMSGTNSKHASEPVKCCVP